MRNESSHEDRRAARGLPVYLDCPKCEGTGQETVEIHGSRCECGGAGGLCPGGHEELVECSSKLCFDGHLICESCKRAGLEPRVLRSGPDYLVTCLVTKMDEGEPVCDWHYSHCWKGHELSRHEEFGVWCECDTPALAGGAA